MLIFNFKLSRGARVDTAGLLCTWANIFHLCHNSSYNQRGKQKVFLYVATTGTGHRGPRGQRGHRAQWQWLAVTVHVRSCSDNRCSRLLTLFFCSPPLFLLHFIVFCVCVCVVSLATTPLR